MNVLLHYLKLMGLLDSSPLGNSVSQQHQEGVGDLCYSVSEYL